MVPVHARLIRTSANVRDMISNLTTNRGSLETTPETTAVSCTSTETQFDTCTALGGRFSKQYGPEVNKGLNVWRFASETQRELGEQQVTREVPVELV